MADKKYSQRNTRKLIKLNTSLALTLPVELVKKLNWKKDQKVVVKKIRGGIQVKDWKK